MLEIGPKSRFKLFYRYIYFMKRIGVFLVVFFVSFQFIWGQIIFRNDFIIRRNPARLENKGITYVTFNVGSRHSWNLNAYGQPSKSIRIDVAALMGRKIFSYQDVVESLYRPIAVYRQSYIPIPLFLMLEPPPRIKGVPYSYFAKRALRRPLLSAKADF